MEKVVEFWYNSDYTSILLFSFIEKKKKNVKIIPRRSDFIG